MSAATSRPCSRLVGSLRRRRWRRSSSRCLGRRVAHAPIGRSTYDDITEHFKYGSIGSEPGGSLLRAGRRRAAAVLGLQGAAVDLPRQAAGRLRVARLRLRARARSADRRVAAPAPRHRPGRASIARSATPAPCATRRTRRRGSCSACRRSSSICRRSSQFVLDCTLDNRLTADNVRGRLPSERRAVRCSSGVLLRVGLVDRLKMQTLDAAQPHRADSRGSACRGGAAAASTRSIRTRRFSSTGSSTGCRASELIGASDYPVALEPEAARGHAPALGRRQRLGRRAQPERRARRRRDAGHGRPRGDQARARLDLDAAAAEVSVCRSTRRSPRAAPRSTSSTASSATPTTASATA